MRRHTTPHSTKEAENAGFHEARWHSPPAPRHAAGRADPGSTQVPNSDTGYAWPVDEWARLDRFLILGTEGGTFYIGERALTKENALAVRECIVEDGVRVVKRTVEISESGRAPKNDPALFVLAMAAGIGDDATRAGALGALHVVARTGTHLFHWLQYVKAFRGWGRGVRKAVGRWYTAKTADELAYQMLKYQARDGWAHRDALRLAHPKAPSYEHDVLFRYATKGWAAVAGSNALRTVVVRLGDREALHRARIHPLAVPAAMKTYAQGRGMKGSGKWDPVSQVADAPDGAFYLSFANASSTGKRVMLALDVSGSMAAPVTAMPYVSCREASAAMALVTAAVEPNHRFVAFTSGSYPPMYSATHGSQYDTGLSPLSISPRQRLDDVVRSISKLSFGGTDCALPMVEALKHRWEVDTFVVYTDNETWAGNIHPAQALRAYRERMGIAAKLVVVAMTSNGFSIADPNDGGMLDVAGFDAATPEVISDFGAEDGGTAAAEPQQRNRNSIYHRGHRGHRDLTLWTLCPQW